MSELIIPGAGSPPPEVFYIVDDRGKETEVAADDFWTLGPDAWNGQMIHLDSTNLPKQEWEQQGDNDD